MLISRKTVKTYQGSFMALTSYPSSGRGRSNYSNRGRGRQFVGRGRGRSSNNITCQIRDKIGHSAANCWYRMNLQYSHQVQTKNPVPPPQANSVIPSECGWLLDSGASAHLSNSSASLHNSPLTMVMIKSLLEIVNRFQSLIKDNVSYILLPVN